MLWLSGVELSLHRLHTCSHRVQSNAVGSCCTVKEILSDDKSN